MYQLNQPKQYMYFCRLLIFFFKINFLSKKIWNTIRVSNRSDPDQARRFVGPDLGANCLQTLSADDTSIQNNRVTQEIDCEHRCAYQ